MPSGGTAPSKRINLRVSSMEQPGWCAGDGTVPSVGERVFSVDGEAEVVRVLGRTSDGSRLLELRLATGSKPPYFAASSNLLRRSAKGSDVTSREPGPTHPRDQVIGGSPVDMIGEPDA